MNDTTLIQKTADYIEAHLEEPLPLEKIADALNYSRFYLARKFHEKTGCTIYKYIQGRRLSLAAQKLVETRKPIVEIAYEANYNSQQAFTLAFERLYEATPYEYRKKGIFTPRQTRISMTFSVAVSRAASLWKGEMAA